MADKGYPFPLYSLDFIPHDATPLDEARYSLPVLGGRLQVRPSLRRLGACTTTEDCRHAVQRGLAHHRRAISTLASHGFGPDWAAALEHWQAALRPPMEARWRLEVELHEAELGRAACLTELRLLLRRLALAARMARQQGLLPAGRLRSTESLLRLLDPVTQRLAAGGEPLAALLAAHGFGPAQRQRLEEARAHIGPLMVQVQRLRAERQAESDRLAVIRGAILGDLALLCRVAAQALGPMRPPGFCRTQVLPSSAFRAEEEGQSDAPP